MRIAVTGKQGQVAQSLAEIGAERDVEIVLVGRPELDLQDVSTVYDAIARMKPDVIVSAAAHTAVDKAESEPETAFAINATGAGAVASAAARLDIPVIHLSTDYVFDGSLDRPYREDDAVGPTSVYGASKLEGERLVAAATANHAILRTAWVYSPFGNNFVKTMLRLGETRAELGVVADQIGCPTSAMDIAGAVITVARRLATDPSPSLRGIFHLTGSGEASWADFAGHVFRSAEAGGRGPVKVNPITTADYPTPARRPANSRLSSDKLQQQYGIRLPDWRVSADRAVGRLLSNI